MNEMGEWGDTKDHLTAELTISSHATGLSHGQFRIRHEFSQISLLPLYLALNPPSLGVGAEQRDQQTPQLRHERLITDGMPHQVLPRPANRLVPYRTRTRGQSPRLAGSVGADRRGRGDSEDAVGRPEYQQ